MKSLRYQAIIVLSKDEVVATREVLVIADKIKRVLDKALKDVGLDASIEMKMEADTPESFGNVTVCPKCKCNHVERNPT